MAGFYDIDECSAQIDEHLNMWSYFSCFRLLGITIMATYNSATCMNTTGAMFSYLKEAGLHMAQLVPAVCGDLCLSTKIGHIQQVIVCCGSIHKIN